jgi:hypothetical protein
MSRFVTGTIVILIGIGFVFSCEKAKFEGDAKNKKTDDGTGNESEYQSGSPGSENGSKGPHEPEGFTDKIAKDGWIDEKSLEELLKELGPDKPLSQNNDKDSDPGNEDAKNSDNQSEIADSNDPNCNLDQILTDPNGTANVKDGETYLFWQPCDREKAVTQASTAFKGPRGAKIRIAGGFCPKAVAPLNILFVVDFSGSMIGNALDPANDPIKGGSCGRLDAIRAVIAKVKREVPDEADVKAGLAGFSFEAKEKLSLQPLEDLEGSINIDNACGSDGENAKTNYKAALETSLSILSGVDEQKTVIYFISDGEPTWPRPADDQSDLTLASKLGLQAAQSLRSSITDLTFNIIYLGNADAELESRSYLDEISGDAKSVVLVQNADELTEAATSLKVPEIGMQKETIKAKALADTKKRSVVIEKFQLGKKSKQWIFITEPFPLWGETGSVVENRLNVLAKTDEEKELAASIRVDFTQVD